MRFPIKRLLLASTWIAAFLCPLNSMAVAAEDTISTARASDTSSSSQSAQPTRVEGIAVFSMRASRLYEARTRALISCLNRAPQPSAPLCITEGNEAGRTAIAALDGMLNRIGSPPKDIEDTARALYRSAAKQNSEACAPVNNVCKAQAKWAAERAADQERARLLEAGSGPVAWESLRIEFVLPEDDDGDEDWGISSFLREQEASNAQSGLASPQEPPITTGKDGGCRTVDTFSETRDPATGAITTTRGRSMQCGKAGTEAARRVQEMLDEPRR